MIEKEKIALNKLFIEAGLDDAISKVNDALQEAGYQFRVDTVTFADVSEWKPCKCLGRGVIGESCSYVNGVEKCKPIYGCHTWDCT